MGSAEQNTAQTKQQEKETSQKAFCLIYVKDFSRPADNLKITKKKMTYFSRKLFSLTSTENDGSNKQGQVAVIQLQSIELDRKLKLGLHDFTKGLS